MYLALVFGFCFLSVAFAAPAAVSKSVPEIDNDMFVRKGDILELNPKYANRRNLVVGENKLWENGVVPFFIKEDMEEHRGKIYQAMNHISNRTCIRFRPKTDDDKEYIHIYNGGGCFAYVGRIGQYVPVSLGPGCEELIPASHEILHSLGVHHTQCRSDRDKFLTVHFENMYAAVKHNYRKLAEDENQLLVPFDFDSIMLYGPYMASENGEAVMTANDPNQKYIDTYEKTGLSDYDIEALNKLYKCERYGSQFAYGN